MIRTKKCDRDWSPVWALSNVNLLHLVLHLQMAARYAANKQINLKKSEAAFRELIERLDCPEEGRSLSSHIWIWSNEWKSQVLKSTVKHWHCVCVCFVLWQITRHRQLLSCISSFWALVQKMCTPVTFFAPLAPFENCFDSIHFSSSNASNIIIVGMGTLHSALGQLCLVEQPSPD